MSTLIESLLDQSEGTALDFKKEQYPFAKATKEQKSKLLKHIIAFANSWRQDEAYIVIGVEEVAPGRYIPVGTEDHFDDSRLQQFINGKTNRKLKLAYEVHLFEGKKIGVIRIPKQERPIYATKNYGEVRKETVYYRLGSSTETANPDDIARMGRDDVEMSKYIQLKKDSNSIQQINKAVLKREARRGHLICVFGLAIFVLLSIVSFLGKSNILSSNYFIWFLLYAFIVFYFVHPYLDSMYLYSIKPNKLEEAIFVGKGRLMEINDSNNFITYTPTAKCIYPNCHKNHGGMINIVNAPQKEILRSGKKYIGICSVAGKDHSYHIDKILVATDEALRLESSKKC